jgi:hypothetical protein
MLMIAIVLFLLAAVFGAICLVAILKGQRPSSLAALAHGSFAFIALLVLIAAVATGHKDMLLISSLGLFILAALGGFTLLSFDLRDKPFPKALALGHPLLAVTALIMLIVYVVQAMGGN